MVQQSIGFILNTTQKDPDRAANTTSTENLKPADRSELWSSGFVLSGLAVALRLITKAGIPRDAVTDGVSSLKSGLKVRRPGGWCSAQDRGYQIDKKPNHGEEIDS